MKILSSENLVSVDQPVLYADVDKGFINNYVYYDKQSWRPTPFKTFNLTNRNKYQQLITNRMLKNWVIDKRTTTLADYNDTSYSISNLQSENIIIDNINPNIVYTILDSIRWISSTTSSENGYPFQVLKSTFENDILISQEILLIGADYINGSSSFQGTTVYFVTQSDTHLFLFTNNSFRSQTGNSATTDFRLYALPKINSIQQADYIRVYASKTGYDTSNPGTSGICQVSNPSIIEDTPEYTLFNLMVVYATSSSSNTAFQAFGQNIIKFDKTSHTVEYLPNPELADNFLFQTGSTLPRATGLFNVNSSEGYHHTDDRLYTFTMHTETLATLQTSTFNIYMLGFDNGVFVSNNIMTINWGDSGLEQLPFPNIQIYSSYVYKIVDTTYRFVVTKTSSGIYLHAIYRSVDVDIDCAIYTFKIDIENKTLNWVGKYDMFGSTCHDVLFFDPMRFGGNNTKMIVANANGHQILEFNSSTESWVELSKENITSDIIGIDREGQILVLDNNSNIYMFNQTSAVNIEFDFAEPLYYYEGTPITSNIIANAYNFEGSRVDLPVTFTISGPGIWQSTGTANITTTLSATEDTLIPFTTTGREGTLNIYAKPAN